MRLLEQTYRRLMRQEMLDQVTQTLFAIAWSNFVDWMDTEPERAEDARLYRKFHGEPPSLMGVEITGVMPEPSEDAKRASLRVLQELERMNPNFGPRAANLARAAGFPLRELMHYLVTEAVGIGVSWSDNVPEKHYHQFTLPDLEVMLWVDPETGELCLEGL